MRCPRAGSRALQREAFLAAVTGHRTAHAEDEAIVEERLSLMSPA
jgi:hypothetical protein